MSGHDPERLSALLDGELSADEEHEVRAHVQACAECQAILATLRRVDEEARAHPAGEPPEGYFDDFARRVGARIEAERGSRAGHARSRIHWPLWAGAAAAAVVLAVLVPRTLERGAPALAPQQNVGRRQEAPAAPALADEARRDDAGRAQPAERVTEVLEPAPTPRPEPEPRSESASSSPPAALAPRLLEKKEAPLAAGEAGEREGFAAAPSRLAREAPTEETPMPADREKDDRDLPARPGRSRAAVPESAPPPAAPAAGLSRSREADARPLEQPLPAAPAGAPAYLESGATELARLLARTPTTAEGWRETREALRAWAATYPDDPRADEARVRVIEDGVAAWRSGERDEDLTRAREDLAAYLARPDARQKDRARRAVPEPDAL